MTNRVEEMVEPQLVSVRELASRLPARVPPWVTAGLLSVSGLETLNRAHANLGNSVLGHHNLFEEALSRLGVQVDVRDEELAKIPTHGPVIIVSNHPFGGIDGLALGAKTLRRRKDVRIVTNSLLSRITKLAPWFLDVAVLDSKTQAWRNARQLRLALKHLAEGGLLVVFPAGEVSHFQPQAGAIEDVGWSNSVAMLARRSGASILPCYFEGANSTVFQAAGFLHPTLRTFLLPREMLARRGTKVRLNIGRLVEAKTALSFDDVEVFTAWLRLRCYDLQHASARSSTSSVCPVPTPVMSPRNPRLVQLELSELPERQKLLKVGRFQVVLAQRSDMPETLEEVARLRELTFRKVSEGTGDSKDADAFDDHYHHLVLFDNERQCVAGAYRLAFCDEVIATRGFTGLYTSQLFRYRAGMREELRHAIELGRSFVAPEYQKQSSALALLWRGIGEILVRNPKCRRLIGPVSISEQYRGSARRMLLAFLRAQHGSPRLAKLVEPRRPAEVELTDAERMVLISACRNLREFSRTLEPLNDSLRPVPVLLERYLALGGKVAAFSVDPAFNNCVDALIAVDIDSTPQATLRRFLGATGYVEFASYGARMRERRSG